MNRLSLVFLVFFSSSVFFAYSQSSELDIETYYEGSLKGNGRMVIVFSPNKYENIFFTSTISSKGSNRIYALRLQYSLDKKEWVDIMDSRGRIIQYVSSGRYKSSTYKVNLPDVCEGEDSVWISWISTRLRGSGAYPNLSIKDISLRADYDRYYGKKPEINTRLRSQDSKVTTIQDLVFNHTPIPYTYPQTKRIVISGRYIRDDIKVSISGKDNKFFHTDINTLKIDSSGFGIIELTYAPLRVGSHSASLNITTRKLDKTISINLNGSSAKVVELNSNLLDEKTTQILDRTIYRIPVFSELDYQFKFDYLPEEFRGKDIRISYKWYRDTEELFEMEDRILCGKSTQDDMVNSCTPITSPEASNYLQIEFKTSGQRIEISNLYFGSPTFKRSISSGLWSDDNIWEPTGVPVMEDFVYISPKNKIRVDDDVVCSMLVLGDSSNVIIDPGKMFYISGDIMYSRGSWFVVHQDLVPKRWNYISSPVNDSKALIYSMRKDGNETWLMEYNTGVRSKLKDYWSEYIVDPNHRLVPGKGYAVYTNEKLDVIYEGILCDSRVNYKLEFKEDDSWNLVGNPFTAPLSSKKIFEDIDQKIQGNAIFVLDRENGVYNPIIIDGKEEVVLPSMEGFFVESIRENTEISFQRKHQYIPNSASYHWSNHNYLTFNIHKGSKTEYILMGMDDNSTHGFDKYDAHKLFGTSDEMPEIYFIVDSQELAVNVFPSYPASYDIGYYIGKESNLSLSLGNLSILPMGVALFLEDRYENKFTNLCDNSSVDFNALKGTTDYRFRVHILRSLDMVFDNDELSDIYLWSYKSKIMVCDVQENTNTVQRIRVWDKRRNNIIEEDYKDGGLVLSYNFPKESYLIDILVDDVWIENLPIEVR